MRVLGIDIETTGLEQEKGHRIIEIAACLYDLDTEKLVGKYTQRINPKRAIDPAAQAVHGISFSELSDCPTWEEVAPKVLKLMSVSDVIVAHNGIGFDLPFIAGELVRAGLSIPSVKVLDTMISGRWATPLGKFPKLQELCFACDVDYDEVKAHGALYDVQVMMESFFVGFKKGFFELEKNCE